ncbi:3-oxoacyl-ACP synthase III family protein [Nocardia sp. NPDC052566]|uniref:3-oxoacyl-ACP synthase III family protein n=1 Tax=Nocardia sp. NPDC052566 TaxID=3364330 RepID=UPI0037C6436D
MTAGIVDLAAARPGEIVDNGHFDSIGLTDEWIKRRTGIAARHWIGENDSLLDTAAEVCRTVIERTEDPSSIGALVLVTTSGTDRVPGLAQRVAQRAGLPETVMAFDMNAACSGFVFGLITGLSLCDAGRLGSVLLCNAEAMSTMIDKTDRQTAVLFGDGVTATLLADRPEFAPFHGVAGGDGGRADLMRELPGGGIHLDGVAVYDRAVRRMSETARTLCAGDPPPTVLIGHQANGRILEQIRTFTTEFGVPFVNRIAASGNTSSATIPLAFADELADGALPVKGRLGAVAYGAGESWGGVAVDYQVDR